MEHLRIKPLKGVSAPEPTAFTMKTIKELMVEEGGNPDDAFLTSAPTSTPAPASAPEQHIQQPPQFDAEAQHREQQTRDVFAMDDAVEPQAPAEKKRSLLGRLIGR